MEMEGLMIPRLLKCILCVPPAPLALTSLLTPFKESLGLIDEKVLSQLELDTKDFDLLRQPALLIKFENEETIDPRSGYL
jgi:hypothetical protein